MVRLEINDPKKAIKDRNLKLLNNMKRLRVFIKKFSPLWLLDLYDNIIDEVEDALIAYEIELGILEGNMEEKDGLISFLDEGNIYEN